MTELIGSAWLRGLVALAEMEEVRWTEPNVSEKSGELVEEWVKETILIGRSMIAEPSEKGEDNGEQGEDTGQQGEGLESGEGQE